MDGYHQNVTEAPRVASGQRALAECQPFILASRVGAAGDLEPPTPDLGLAPLRRIDPFHVASGSLATRLHRLQHLAGAARDRRLERW
ncbi:MAG: hypothetical protein ACYTGG_07085, partial [Planctomycetota bacterium]